MYPKCIMKKNELLEKPKWENLFAPTCYTPFKSTQKIIFGSLLGAYRNRNIMAVISSKYPFGSAQIHIPTCWKHDLTIDMTCDDCDEFICSQCAKSDHKDHYWKTISTAGIQRRKELRKMLWVRKRGKMWKRWKVK